MKQNLFVYSAIIIFMKLCKSFSYLIPRRNDIARGLRINYNIRRLVSPATSSESIETTTNEPVTDLLSLELPTNDNINLLKMRHTSAHVMAMAVQKVFPTVKVTIGPWIDNG